MRTTANSVPNTQYSNNPGYSPSVPLSVYRDLAAELQAAQAMVDSLSAQNQQLSQENQILRQEIAKVVNSVIQLQQSIQPKTSYNPEVHSTANHNKQNYQPPVSQPRKPRPVASPKRTKVNRVQPPEATPDYFPVSEPVYIEEQEVRYYPYHHQKPETNGWALLLAILLIVLTAFGAGYLIVRPLLAKSSGS
ncbi:MAG: hypothetical protein IGS39_02400 [Calothrix sp. C42_A2020_038]|nr:hypothetical protein [Calothrix sp. C42_A2020_038]